MITCHNWPPRFPRGLCYVFSWRQYLRWWLWSLQEVTQFPCIFPICKIYMLLNFCFSPNILALIMEKEGSVKNQKGRGKLFFLLYTCKAIILNSGQEWKVSPWKTGINVRCIWLSERMRSEEAEYSMTPLMTFLERQIYTDVKRDPEVGNLKWSFRWIPVNMRLLNISIHIVQGVNHDLFKFPFLGYRSAQNVMPNTTESNCIRNAWKNFTIGDEVKVLT